MVPESKEPARRRRYWERSVRLRLVRRAALRVYLGLQRVVEGGAAAGLRGADLVSSQLQHAAQVGTVEIGVLQIRAVQDRAVKMRTVEIGAVQIGINKYGSAELSILQMGAAELSGPEVGLL